MNTTTDYFLAGRNIGWFVVGASLFASNIGSEHIVGLAGNGASTGMAMAHWELHAWVMIMLGWVFVPFYYRPASSPCPSSSRGASTPGPAGCSRSSRLVAYVFTKVSVTVYAGALVFKTLLPDTFGTPGERLLDRRLRHRDPDRDLHRLRRPARRASTPRSPRPLLLLMGSVFITFFGLHATRRLGRTEDHRRGQRGELRPLARPLSDPDFPWLGILIASPVIGIWYWCTDQYIVQRTLAAKNLTNARRGAIWGGFLKVWPVMIFLIPGPDRLGARTRRASSRIPMPRRTAGHRWRPGVPDHGARPCCRPACAAWWSAACLRP